MTATLPGGTPPGGLGAPRLVGPSAEVDPFIVALVAAAVDQVWPRPVATVDRDAADRVHQVWRFSGRWWNRPTPIRRERPWAGPGR